MLNLTLFSSKPPFAVILLSNLLLFGTLAQGQPENSTLYVSQLLEQSSNAPFKLFLDLIADAEKPIEIQTIEVTQNSLQPSQIRALPPLDGHCTLEDSLKGEKRNVFRCTNLLVPTQLPQIPSQFRMVLESKQRMDLIKVKITAVLEGKRVNVHKSPLRVALVEMKSLFNELKPLIKGNLVTLNPREYLLRQSLYIPPGFRVRVLAGTTLRLNPGVSVVSRSPVDFLGEAHNPIKIIGSDANRPWGSFAVVAPKQEMQATYLTVSGGSQALIEAMEFKGQMSLHHLDVKLSHSRFENSQGEDSLNIKFSKIRLENVMFANAKGDLFDGDQVIGQITNSHFSNAGNDAIDFSHSLVTVRNSTVENAKDKCISVGESTQLVGDNLRLRGCRTALASKDDSIVKLGSSQINNAEVAFAGFRKFERFKRGGTIFIDNKMKLENVQKMQQIDSYSLVRKL
ncbi:MAG: hypothetical protein IT289_11375 [Oligoflexia bacterium]|nr:hypothetical protein [Oligoflexia bacterium]